MDGRGWFLPTLPLGFTSSPSPPLSTRLFVLSPPPPVLLFSRMPPATSFLSFSSFLLLLPPSILKEERRCNFHAMPRILFYQTTSSRNIIPKNRFRHVWFPTKCRWHDYSTTIQINSGKWLETYWNRGDKIPSSPHTVVIDKVITNSGQNSIALKIHFHTKLARHWKFLNRHTRKSSTAFLTTIYFCFSNRRRVEKE